MVKRVRQRQNEKVKKMHIVQTEDVSWHGTTGLPGSGGLSRFGCPLSRPAASRGDNRTSRVLPEPDNLLLTARYMFVRTIAGYAGSRLNKQNGVN